MRHEDNIKKAIDTLDEQLTQGTNPPEDLTPEINELNQTLSALRKQWLSKSWNWARKLVLGLKIAAVLAVLGLSSAWFALNPKSKMPNNSKSISMSQSISNSVKSENTILVSKDTSHDVHATFSKVEQTHAAAKNAPILAIKAAQKYVSEDKNKEAFQIESIDSSQILAEQMRLLLLEKNRALVDYRTFINKNGQEFTINNSRDTTIVGEQGTSIFFPAGCFKTKGAGSRQTIIRLTEFSNAYEMYKNRIGTNCEQGLLESGGSCYVSATQNGKEVGLDSGRSIKVSFKNKWKTGYTTFYGESTESGPLWKQSEDIEEKFNISDTDGIYSQGGSLFGIFFRDIFKRGYSKFGVKADFRRRDGKTSLAKNIGKVPVLDSVFKPLRDLDDRIAYRMSMSRVGAGLKLKAANVGWDHSVILYYTIEEDGSLQFDHIMPMYNKVVQKRLTKKLKQINLSETVYLPDSLSGSKYRLRVTLKPFSKNSRADVFSDSLQDKAYEFMNTIQSSRLGFINCDRFMGKSNTYSGTLKVPYYGGLHYLYIPRINSLLRLREAQTLSLPKNMNLKYLGLVETKDGLMMYQEDNLPKTREYTISTKAVPYNEEEVKAFFE